MDKAITMEDRIELRVRANLVELAREQEPDYVADLIWDTWDEGAREQARDEAREELEAEDAEVAAEAEADLIEEHIVGMSLVQIATAFVSEKEDGDTMDIGFTVENFKGMTTRQLARFLQANMQDRSRVVDMG